MEEPCTPPFAELLAGITIDDIRDAISKSGYPFQAVVAETIRTSPLGNISDLHIQEEWAYIDRETGQARSIDILIDGRFKHENAERKSKLGPRLNVLVECKQSDLPYIFFLRHSPPSSRNNFPEIFGLDHQQLRIFTNEAEEEGKDRRSFSWWMNLRDALDFSQLTFFGSPAPYAISLAKVARRGAKVELTGEDAYRSLTLPLLKGADHLKKLSLPDPDHPLRFPRITVSVAVIRAPMLATFLNGEDHELISLPWVRVSHLEPTNSSARGHEVNGIVRYFDVVHESFLPRYLEVLARDADAAILRMHEHSEELMTGVGFSSEGTHETLRPIPESLNQFLEQPCTIEIHKAIRSLRLKVNKNGGQISDPTRPREVGWIDEYPWLGDER